MRVFAFKGHFTMLIFAARPFTMLILPPDPNMQSVFYSLFSPHLVSIFRIKKISIPSAN
jgi:hypothetical protein